jgi:amino-acid N-acetyltransferase
VIRKAKVSDAKNIQKLINSYADKGEMLPVSLHDVYENIFKFVIWDEDGEVRGCSACHVAWEDLCEIRSVAVSVETKQKGVGTQLINACLDMAREVGVNKVFLLTYVPDFFKKFGFEIVDMEVLPKKIWSDCLKCVKFPDCDEIAMELKL